MTSLFVCQLASALTHTYTERRREGGREGEISSNNTSWSLFLLAVFICLHFGILFIYAFHCSGEFSFNMQFSCLFFPRTKTKDQGKDIKEENIYFSHPIMSHPFPPHPPPHTHTLFPARDVTCQRPKWKQPWEDKQQAIIRQGNVQIREMAQGSNKTDRSQVHGLRHYPT